MPLLFVLHYQINVDKIPIENINLSKTHINHNPNTQLRYTR